MKNVSRLLSRMTNNVEKNMRIIQSEVKSIYERDEEEQSLLHIFVDNKYDEERCFLAIKTLLKFGFDPNLEDCFNYNFIQTALYAGYSEKFIMNIIEESLKYGLDINHIDSDKDTIMHTVIYSDDYIDNIINIYDLLYKNGFDSTKIDHDGRNLLEAMEFQNQYSKSQINIFREKFLKRATSKLEEKKSLQKRAPQKSVKKAPPVIEIPENVIKTIEKYGRVLTKKEYSLPPTIGREKEIKSVIIGLAQDKKHPMLVGEAGVGKTAIIDELAYRIQKGQVPPFLQDKTVIEINPHRIGKGIKYVGTFEEKMAEVMDLCEKYGIIVVIDEIHTIYGIGSSSNNDNDMAAILQRYIDNQEFKIIGMTTKDKYQKYFAKDALKRRFDKIKIEEPKEEVLYQIIDKVFNDYCIKKKIFFENEHRKEQIKNIIIDLTNKKHRNVMDKINNPDLSIHIIDKAFAIAMVYDGDFIKPEHFIDSIESNDRLGLPGKVQAIARLKKLDENVEKKEEMKTKVLKVDFNNPQK